MKILKRIKSELEESLGNEVIGLDESEIFRSSKPSTEPSFDDLTEEDNSLDFLNTDIGNETINLDEGPVKKKNKKGSILDKVAGLTKKKEVKPMKTVENSFVDMPNTGRVVTANDDESPVLQFLDIPRRIDLSGLATPDTIENVEFTLSVPSGINPDEVEKFLNYLQKDLSRLYRRIAVREEDFDKLLTETNRLQDRIIETNQKRSMLAALDQDKGVVDKLKDEIVDLRMKNVNLQNEVNKYKVMEKEFEKLKIKEEIRAEEEKKQIKVDDVKINSKKQNVNVASKGIDKDMDAFSRLIDDIDN